MITVEEFKNLSDDEILDTIECMSGEERIQLVKELFPNFRMKCSKMGYDNEGRNKYKITISNGNMPFSTVFYDSIYNTQRDERSDDFNILYCIISDAQSYEYNEYFEDFCNEFGYTDIDKPKKIYNGCKRAYENLTETFGYEGYKTLRDLTYNY